MPQTQLWCGGDFATWDHRITTFPGACTSHARCAVQSDSCAPEWQCLIDLVVVSCDLHTACETQDRSLAAASPTATATCVQGSSRL